MANYLILNQPQVFVGLGTLTYTVVTTGAFNVQFRATVPQQVLEGDGAGSGTGLGSGTGGGGQGFVLGDRGTGYGGVGQGFGTANNYQQPPSAGSNQSTFPAVTSGLVVVVNNNGSPIYTANAIAGNQSQLEFKYSFLATAADSITVVLTSAVADDALLNSVKSTTTIGEGL